MKLSFETIKKITVGAVRIWEDGENIRFSKCTQKQIDAWYKLSDVLGMRAETTTGVRLDFHTDSSLFAFTAAMGNKYEIYVNNILMYDIRFSNGEKCFEIKLDTSARATNRVTLILSSHEISALSSVELDDGATVEPCNFDRKIMFIGDSITQGWDSGYDSLSYAYRVSRFFNAETIIHGVGGGFFDESVLDDELEFDPDIIIIAFGTNDWGHYKTIDALRDETKKFFDKLCSRYEGKKIFAISPIWRADNNLIKASGSFPDVCDTVKEQILAHSIILVDGLSMVPHLPEFYSDKYLHPNALGFGVYAENLIKTLNNNI